MKNKTYLLWKRIVSMLTSVARANSIVVKNKTSALKTRFLMSSLFRNKKTLTGSISNKIHCFLGHHLDREAENAADYEYNGDRCKALVLYNTMVNNESDQVNPNCINLVEEYEDDGDEKYPDLRHSLFDELDEYDDNAGSIIDLVRNSKEDGECFSLEDEIDHVADLFITRFHKQMRLQKLLSFKRFQERVERSAP